MTATGIVFVSAPLLSCGGGGGQPADADSNTENRETVYRFQKRRSNRCNACRNHQHYKVFLNAAAADANRAHLGCNCRIVEQRVTPEYLASIMPYQFGGVVDLRAVYA